MYYLGPVRHGANIIHSKKPIRSIEDFNGLRVRLPGGMVAELFQAAGAKTTMLPGSEILAALAQDNLDAADSTGPAVNPALALQTVPKSAFMGPAGVDRTGDLAGQSGTVRVRLHGVRLN